VFVVRLKRLSLGYVHNNCRLASTFRYDLVGNELGFKTVEPSALVFTVASADVANGGCLPDSDCKLRICHSFTVHTMKAKK
jgi:hypothetical protein